MLKDKVVIKQEKKARIRQRIRKTIRGTADRPRLHVFKSNRYMYTQAVNDENGTILAAASTLAATRTRVAASARYTPEPLIATRTRAAASARRTTEALVAAGARRTPEPLAAASARRAP